MPNGLKKLYEAENSWDENSITWANYGYSEGDGNVNNGNYLVNNTNTSYNTWENYDVTSSISNYLNNPSSNNGFMLVMNISGYDRYSVKYPSSEYSDETLRPKLVIEYTGGTPQSSLTLTSQNDGDVIITNSDEDINWTSENLSGNVKLELLNRLGIETISSSESNDGTFLWNLENRFQSGNGYQIIISSIDDPSVSDTTEPFTIMQSFIDSNHVLINQSNLSLLSFSSEETSGEDGAAANMLDGNTNTIWHSEWSASQTEHPHEFVISLGEKCGVSAVTYNPRQSGVNGIVNGYVVYYSNDGNNWSTADSGKLTDDSKLKYIEFESVEASFIKFKTLSAQNDAVFASASEFNVYKDLKFGGTEKFYGSLTDPANLIKISNNKIFWNSNKEASVSIYSLSGKAIVKETINKRGVYYINNGNNLLSKGVYLAKVSINGLNSKVLKFNIK